MSKTKNISKQQRFKISIYFGTKLSLDILAMGLEKEIYEYLDFVKDMEPTMLDLIMHIEDYANEKRGDLMGGYKAKTLFQYGYFGDTYSKSDPMLKMKETIDMKIGAWRLDIYMTAYYRG